MEKAYSITPSLSDDRKLMFAVVIEKYLTSDHYKSLGLDTFDFIGQKISSYINVIDIKHGEIISRIHCHGKMNLNSLKLIRSKSPLESQIGSKKFG